MKETGSVEPMGSQLGLPGAEKSIERTKYSHMPHRGAMYHFESVFVSFSFGKGIFLLSSVPRVGSVLQLGHTVMHTCTSTHKHNEICTRFLPRYIIISTKLYRLSGVPDWKSEEAQRESLWPVENSRRTVYNVLLRATLSHIHN